MSSKYRIFHNIRANLNNSKHSSRISLIKPTKVPSKCLSFFTRPTPQTRDIPHFMPSYPNYFYPSRLSSRYKSGAAIFPTHESMLASKEQVILADLPPPWAQKWLFICAGLTVGVIVVGGVTRLTESGLSITEWKPITGILPPMNDQAWMVEFDKYRLTPEFKL
jgi:hypothetical protein